MSDDPQAEAVALLADPATHGGQPVERIDTHISTIFLAGDRAYKLKKAVRLPFLDFSTLEARHQACLAELEVNRAAAPSLYLGLAAVTRQGQGLALDGDGAVVEWLVVMRRFDPSGLFDQRAAQGRLDRAAICALTDAVARLHAQAPLRPDHGGVANMVWTIDTNARSMAAHVPAVLEAAQVETLRQQAHQRLAGLAVLLEERRAAGKVRRCHGDLHLGNICLLDGVPTLFDAIEFSEDIACIDVLYDLAFLLMDLDRRAGRALASHAQNHYLDLTGDYDGLAALPLFLSCRAGVRAHVCATMAAHADGDRRRRLQDDARAYLDAALAYLAPPSPRLLAVGGLSGSGKSRMGRELAPSLGVPGAAVVRTDAIRKQLMGAAPLQRLGPEAYGAEMTQRTYAAFLATCAGLLRAGVPVVADAVFARPEQRAAIEQVARDAGVPFDGLWLDAPPEEAARRIAQRAANISDATPQVLAQQLSYDLGTISWLRIDTQAAKDETLRRGRQALGLE